MFKAESYRCEMYEFENHKQISWLFRNNNYYYQNRQILISFALKNLIYKHNSKYMSAHTQNAL